MNSYILPSYLRLQGVLNQALKELERQEDLTTPGTDLCKQYRYCIGELKTMIKEDCKPAYEVINENTLK